MIWASEFLLLIVLGLFFIRLFVYFGVVKLGGLEAFRAAECVKVNPDSPQKQVRFLTLSGLLFCHF